MSRLCLLICLCVSAGLLSPADARERGKERRDKHELRRDVGDERGDSSAAAAARLAVEANGGGRVLSVDRKDGGYRVKVLKDGEVRTHHITLE